MYGIVFDYGGVRFIEVAVVGFEANRLRLIPKGGSDTIELIRKGSEWISETGEAFAVGFIAPVWERARNGPTSDSLGIPPRQSYRSRLNTNESSSNSGHRRR